jgi:type II secretory pathway pseudopilin PulG
MTITTHSRHAKAGFSLVEVTVAIGIFAFVVVGILGLLPAGMRLQQESAAESRALMIAEELMASVDASPSLRQVVVRDGPALQSRNNSVVDVISGPVVLGYPARTSVPFGLWHPSRSNSPEDVWDGGILPTWAIDNDIQTLSRLSATQVSPGLYQVRIEVRAPANVPANNTTPTVFTTYRSSS